jgi:hypothetical protein
MGWSAEPAVSSSLFRRFPVPQRTRQHNVGTETQACQGRKYLPITALRYLALVPRPISPAKERGRSRAGTAPLADGCHLHEVHDEQGGENPDAVGADVGEH